MAFGDIASGLGERVAEWAEGLYDENGGPVETVDIVDDEETDNSLTEMVEDVDHSSDDAVVYIRASDGEGSASDGEGSASGGVFAGISGSLFVLLIIAAFIKNARSKKKRRNPKSPKNDAGEENVVVDIANIMTPAFGRQWQKHVAQDGRTYYSNTKSGEVSWTLPKGANLV